MSIFKKNSESSTTQNDAYIYAASAVKENVQAAGGKVDGALRFSIQWNDIEADYNDLDAHCKEPAKGQHIYFKHKVSTVTSGNLDVDIINPILGKAAVENITYPSKDKLVKGIYMFYVHCYNDRGGKGGFRAEIECDGKTYQYNFMEPVKKDQKVKVALVKYDGRNMTITHSIKPMRII